MEIISYMLPEFEYLPPRITIDDNGEIRVDCEAEEHAGATKVHKSIFLYCVVRCENTGEIKEFNGLDHVNAFLMYRSVVKGAEDTKPIAKALLCYHQFLANHNLQWDQFPVRNFKKPTYQFKRYLEQLYQAGELAASTAKAYMSQVVRFYKFYLRRMEFDNPPFEYEVVSINVASKHSSISSTRNILITSTDLRLKIATSNSEMPNKLRALSDTEWNILDEVLRLERCGLRLADGVSSKVSIATEFMLLFLLMRYTGLRREEALTLPALLIKPDQSSLGYADIHISTGVGVHTKGGKARSIEIPVQLSNLLHKYKCSERYNRRFSKFILHNPDVKHVPLFLTQDGKPFSVDSVNARWSEIRKYIREKHSMVFDHKPHNLRATYGTFRLRELIMGDNPLQVSKALVYIQDRMGHQDLSTTEKYLSQLKSMSDAFSLTEHAIDFHLDQEQ